MSRNSDIIRDSRGFLAIKRVLLVALIAVVGGLFLYFGWGCPKF